MNIWIFNHYANGPGVNGVTRHFDLAKQLVKKGHQVTIFCSSFNHWSKKDLFSYEKGEYYKKMSYEGVQFIYFKTHPYTTNGLDRVRSMLSFYKQTGKFNYSELNIKPDYVIGSILHHFAAVRAYKISKKYNSRFLFEERDLWPATLIDLGKVKRNNPLVKLLDFYETYMYKKAHKIIVLFDKAHYYIEKKNIDLSKVIYLPNGIELERYKDEVRQPLNVDKIVIGYVGAHGLANNLDRVIELATKMKDNKNVIFRFVGEGTNKSDLIEKANQLNLHNCIFENGVPKEQVPEILMECDFGIISLKDSPLYKYGFSLNKLYDYMGAKLPILLDTTVEANFINEHDLGIATKNLNEIQHFVEQMTVEQYQKMSVNVYNYVIQNHSWDKLADKLLENI